MDTIQLKVNGTVHELTLSNDTPLLWALRDELKLKGTKYGCGLGLCGACTVHVEGRPARSCQLKLSDVKEKEIITIEGIGLTTLHVIQQSWIDEQVPQCGYCQSGQIMTALALLSSNPSPSNTEINDAMSGNLCRCGTYGRIQKAIRRACTLIDEPK